MSSNKQSFDLNALNALDIGEVIEVAGGRRVNNKIYHCFNHSAHKADDKHASLGINRQKNICKCFACGVGGGPIAIAKLAYGDFVSACEALHTAFRVPFKDGSISGSVAYAPLPQKAAKKTKFTYEFDVSKHYTYVDLSRYLATYASLTDAQKLKLVYTYVYRFSLNTDQSKKLDWYEQVRGISKDHSLLSRIGWLDNSDLKDLGKELEELFPLDDLVRFKLYNAADASYAPLSWKYSTDVGFAVVPFDELYSDMVNGLMLRNISPNAGKKKEFQITSSDIVAPITFALNRENLASCDYMYITEGHIDGLSLGEHPFVASPGTFGLSDAVLPLLQGKKIYIAFDMDEPGKLAAEKLKERLGEIGIESVFILEWDENLGNDLNELLLKGNLKRENLKVKKEG